MPRCYHASLAGMIVIDSMQQIKLYMRVFGQVNMLRRARPLSTQASSRPSLFHRNAIPVRRVSTALVPTPPLKEPESKKLLLQNGKAIQPDAHDLQILLRSVTNADLTCLPGRHQEHHLIKFESVAPHPHSSSVHQFAKELSAALKTSGVKNHFIIDSTTVVLKGNLAEIIDSIGSNFGTIQNKLNFSQRQFKKR